eukprot:gene24639-33109_t
MDVLVASSFPELGKLTALRFLEFVQQNPTGVVSLPTGKTPEYFIKWVQHFLSRWDIDEMAAFGLAVNKPSMDRLKFVQMDEFFPIQPSQANSFNNFISKFYIKGFGLNPDNCLLMDTSEFADPSLFQDGIDLGLLTRHKEELSDMELQKRDVLERLGVYCSDYERRIHEMGGVDFFIGGIGPDGHIAFNIRGSNFNSLTRFLQLNYESMAASAESLGGMSAARKKLVITIGLRTITMKPSCQAIIFAAGEAKAELVREAIEANLDQNIPSHALRILPKAIFYLTRGAIKFLSARTPVPQISEASIVKCIERGNSDHYKALKFLHTEPHHDDIMLAYLPFILKSRSSNNGLDVFACGTSGFNSVSNAFILGLVGDANILVKSGQLSFLDETAKEDVSYFALGFTQRDERIQRDAAVHRFIRNLVDGESKNPEAIAVKLDSLEEYLSSLYPGQKDSTRPEMQILKGKCREFESDCLWGTLGWNTDDVTYHLRLGFYTSDVFAPQPVFERDSGPILELLMEERPDVVTLALDPESSGPDTHYKVLQAITAALVKYQEVIGPNGKQPLVWGYRNVWCEFDLLETNLILQVVDSELKSLTDLFVACYQTQKTAEFPSYQLDGPFSQISVNSWKAQLAKVRSHLGPNVILPSETQGLVFIREMSIDELKSYSRSLSRLVDDV